MTACVSSAAHVLSSRPCYRKHCGCLLQDLICLPSTLAYGGHRFLMHSCRFGQPSARQCGRKMYTLLRKSTGHTRSNRSSNRRLLQHCLTTTAACRLLTAPATLPHIRFLGHKRTVTGNLRIHYNIIDDGVCQGHGVAATCPTQARAGQRHSFYRPQKRYCS